MENQEFLENIRNGNGSIVKEYYSDLHKKCVGYFLRRDYDKSLKDAEDVFHKTLLRFIRVIKEKPDFQIEESVESAVLSFMRNDTTNFFTKKQQKSRRTLLVENYDFIKETTDPTNGEKHEIESKLHDIKLAMNLIDNLGEKCKKVLIGRYNGTSYEDLAIELNTTEGYITTIKSRCLKKLQKMFFAEKEKQNI